MASSLGDKLIPPIFVNLTLRFTLLRILCISSLSVIITLLAQKFNFVYFYVANAVVFLHHLARYAHVHLQQWWPNN